MGEKWRFVGNNYSVENGLDTADMETFKKDPIASLAREICQNSIDARLSLEEKVKIEFKCFEVFNEKIPGYEDLKNEIKNCMEYKSKTDSKDFKKLKYMYNKINNSNINCLRISDFNTTGLYGDKFDLLTKGSGITDKVGTSGGSKGIGKYASFVASDINTVFYSTFDYEGKSKSIGISKLCSSPIKNTDEKTLGIGYYSKDNKNTAMDKQLELDRNFKRNTFGTDLYIINFKKDSNWKKEIITMILDSFLLAIYNNTLEVVVDNIIINKDSLKEIVYSDDYIENTKKKYIKSQYILIEEGEGVKVKEMPIFEFGNIKVYVKAFNKKSKELATNSCIMIRYPYMKIKQLQRISNFPCSAMCVIEANSLNIILREVENPQHTDWEYKRKEKQEERKTIKLILAEIKNKIYEYIIEVLRDSDSQISDIEGASEYLPQTSEGELGYNKELQISYKEPSILNKSENKIYSNRGAIASEEDSGLEPDVGGVDEDGNDVLVPEGSNENSGFGIHGGDSEKGFNEEGESEILRKTKLKNIKRVFFTTDIENGEYILVINSNYTEDDCELEIKFYDESGSEKSSEKVQIINCKMGNEELKVKDGKVIGFKIQPGKIKFKLITNLKKYCKCEVNLYANR